MHDQKPLLGLIFNIQKFSVNDGPGIRTTVFIKGCPLRCRWCANPESQLPRIQILQDRQKCLNCHHCLEICPKQAISLAGTQLKWNPLTCTGCLSAMGERAAACGRPEAAGDIAREIVRFMQTVPVSGGKV